MEVGTNADLELTPSCIDGVVAGTRRCMQRIEQEVSAAVGVAPIAAISIKFHETWLARSPFSISTSAALRAVIQKHSNANGATNSALMTPMRRSPVTVAILPVP